MFGSDLPAAVCIRQSWGKSGAFPTLSKLGTYFHHLDFLAVNKSGTRGLGRLRDLEREAVGRGDVNEMSESMT